MYSSKDRVWTVVILVATFAVFRLSPVHLLADSRYEMLFSQQLLRNHSFSLDASAFPELQSHKPGQIHQRGVDLTYHLVQVGERFYYLFPPGSVVLSVPYVALANSMGLSATDRNGIYDEGADARIQAGLAAVIMACLSVQIFLTARLLLPLGWSLLITAGTAFGTPVWSTASRVVWTHTWGMLILGFVLWQIVRAQTKHVGPSPVLLATCLSWLYIVRPTFITSILAITVYVLICHRASVVLLVLTGCLWIAIWLAYFYYHFGQFFPLYYSAQWPYFRDAPSFWEGLAGTLISPGRGLLIYVPMLVFVAYLLVRYWRNVRLSYAALALTVVGLHLALISSFLAWQGGHCYGPRYSSDLVPWFALLGIVAIEARRRWNVTNPTRTSPLRARLEWSFALPLLICSIGLNGIGATSMRASYWNSIPTNVDHDPRRLWDWRDPPFLRPLGDSASASGEPRLFGRSKAGTPTYSRC